MRQLKYNYKKISVCLLTLLMHPIYTHAAAVNDFSEIPAYFDEMYNARDAMLSHRELLKNIAEAGHWVRVSEEEVKNAEKVSEEARQNLAEARRNGEEALKNTELLNHDMQTAHAEYAELSSQLEELQRQIQQLSEELQGYTSVAGFLFQDVDDEGEAEAKIAELWKKFDYEPNRLSDVRAIIQQEYGENGSADYDMSEAEDARAELLEQLEDLQEDRASVQADLLAMEQQLGELAAEQKLLSAEKLQVEQDIKVSEEDWRQSLLDIDLAKRDYQLACMDLERAEKELRQPGGGIFQSIGQEYYSWTGNGRSGHQLYTSYDAGYEFSQGTVSLSSGYVRSSNGSSGGSISSLTDTALTASLRNKHEKNDVNYSFSVNIPTGKSDASVSASVPDLLSRYSTFGEGWNFTPGIEAVHHFNETDSISGRVSYSFRGRYDMKQGIYDENYRLIGETTENVSPGNTFRKELRYMHAGKNEQFLSFLTHQSNGTTRMSPAFSSVVDGAEWQFGAFYSQNFTPKDAFQAYTLQLYTGAGKSEGTAANQPLRKHMYGIGLKHRFDKRQSMNLMVQYLNGSGATNEWRSGLGTASPRRLSVTAGYDLKMSDRETLRIQLERYKQEDRSSGNYHGWNISAVMNWSF